MPIPYTNIKAIKEVMKYRAKKDKFGFPMSFRAIGKKMDKDVKTVYRWYLQGIGQAKTRLKI